MFRLFYRIFFSPYGKQESSGTTTINLLPEGCISYILSYTTPVDACRLSLVSKAFRSAAQSDTLWDRFITSALSSLVSPSSFPSSHSKKHLYFALCDRPIIIHNGTKVTIYRCMWYVRAAADCNVCLVGFFFNIYSWEFEEKNVKRSSIIHTLLNQLS